MYLYTMWRMYTSCFRTSLQLSVLVAGIGASAAMKLYPFTSLPFASHQFRAGFNSTATALANALLNVTCGRKTLYPITFHYCLFLIIYSLIYLLASTQYRQLLSSSSNLVPVPRVKTKTGTRVFSVAASTLWNTLPDKIKFEENFITFPRLLRTNLFKLAYPPKLLSTLIQLLTTFVLP